MTKKALIFLFTLVLMVGLSVPAFATDDSYTYTAKVNGLSSDTVNVGDIITVSLEIKKDDNSSYTIYSMQDYICFDTNYFDFVSGSIELYTAVNESGYSVSNIFAANEVKISSSEWNRVVINRYEDYVMAGGNVEILSFQLEATNAGITFITHADEEMSQDVGGLYSVSTVDATVTISAASTGDDETTTEPEDDTEDDTATEDDSTTTDTTTGTTTSGGSSSSSSSSSSDDDEYDIDVDESSSSSVTAEFDVEATVSSGTASFEIDVDIFEAAIELAQDEASSSDAISIIITIDADDDYDSFSLNLPLEVQEMIFDEDIAFFIVATDNVHIYIDYDAIYTINDIAEDDVQVSVYPADVDDYNLSAADLALIGDRPIYTFEIANDEVTISDFDGGVVTIGIPYEITSSELAGGLHFVYIDEDGNVTAIDGSYYDEDDEMVYADLAHFSTYAVAYDESLATALAFTDVSTSAYYYNAVVWAVANGITNGVTDTTFEPNGSCTRAEAVTFLYRAAGSPEVSGECEFTDVAAGSYYYDAVIWAVANDITKGVSDTEFAPTDLCTRAHIATFLWRAAGSEEVTGDCEFTDLDAEGYYYDAVLWAVANGITNGVTDTTFEPTKDCTRAEIVTFLYRYLGE